MKHVSNNLIAVLVVMAVLSMAGNLVAQDIPSVHSNFYQTNSGLIFRDSSGSEIPLSEEETSYTLQQMRSCLNGSDSGLVIDFGVPEFKGLVYFGLIQRNDVTKFAYPIYRAYALIDSGKGSLNIKRRLTGVSDFVGWQESGRFRLGYRVLNEQGEILYDGKVNIAGTGPFTIDTSIVEGPFINILTDQSAVISYETNYPVITKILLGKRVFEDSAAFSHHEIELTELAPDSTYNYFVQYGQTTESYEFRTAPKAGSPQPFTFAYVCDGRGNYGGGERDIHGTNAYMTKRIGALCLDKEARFLQYTGDMVDGYTSSRTEIDLQYANWKRAAEPFACYIPFIAGMGNHEALVHKFRSNKIRIQIDKFPFAAESAEAAFAANFVNPLNGPVSEDGSAYDPDPENTDFPPYKENVYYFTYGNIAMITLNTEYWFSYTIRRVPEVGGNLHGYIMDSQLAWLKETLGRFEADENIDHIFITTHTPIFPCGGHLHDAMWYNGDNNPRPTIAGKPVRKGIIERRDELLDLLMNHSSKVIAILTGDEHNYHVLRLTEDMPIYPEDYTGTKLTQFRPFWQINNGTGGAPYYGRQDIIWGDHIRNFSTQNVVVFFHVDGQKIIAEVINPDTLEPIDKFEL